MHKERILEAVERYEQRVEVLEAGLERNIYLAHLRTMFPKIRKCIEEGRIEEAFRWLGFIQGVLWSTGLYTLEELRNRDE